MTIILLRYSDHFFGNFNPRENVLSNEPEGFHHGKIDDGCKSYKFCQT